MTDIAPEPQDVEERQAGQAFSQGGTPLWPDGIVPAGGKLLTHGTKYNPAPNAEHIYPLSQLLLSINTWQDTGAFPFKGFTVIIDALDVTLSTAIKAKLTMMCQCQVKVTVSATYHNSKVRRPVLPLNPLTISLQPLCPSSFSLQRRCNSRWDITQSIELIIDRKLHANQQSASCLQCIPQPTYPSFPLYL